MKKNKKALSLAVAISITLVMSYLGLYILEYIIPFSKNTKNIEQSVVAYYQADSGIENALLNNTDKSLNPSKRIDYSIKLEKTGQILPPAGEGNSEFDSNYNEIRTGTPINIEIGKNSINISDLKIYFRIPDLNGDSINDEILKTGLKYINWQIVGKNDVLNSSGSQILSSEIKGVDINLSNKIGIKGNYTPKSIHDFYNDNCRGSNSGCILKMSVINKLELTDQTSVPYLERKIDAGSDISLNYKIINTTGKSYGYSKSLEVKVSKQKLNEIFDFTVYQ